MRGCRVLTRQLQSHPAAAGLLDSFHSGTLPRLESAWRHFCFRRRAGSSEHRGARTRAASVRRLSDPAQTRLGYLCPDRLRDQLSHGRSPPRRRRADGGGPRPMAAAPRAPAESDRRHVSPGNTKPPTVHRLDDVRKVRVAGFSSAADSPGNPTTQNLSSNGEVHPLGGEIPDQKPHKRLAARVLGV